MAKSKAGQYASSQPLFLLDASIYIFRAWFACPDAWHDDHGQPLNAVYGYTRFLLKLLREQEPTHIAAAFDESLGTGFRHTLLPGYKSSRALPDEALAFQLKACRKVTEKLGLSCFAHRRYEADDLIATLARLRRKSSRPLCIISRDKDLAQLLQGDGDYLWDYSGESVNDGKTDVKALYARLGIRPQQVVDYLSLVGDPVDDVPGVPGIGKKTAQQLLAHFGSLAILLKQLDDIPSTGLRGARRIQRNITEHSEQLKLVQQVIALADDAPIKARLDDLRWRRPERAPLKRYLARIGLQGQLQASIDNSTVFSDT